MAYYFWLALLGLFLGGYGTLVGAGGGFVLVPALLLLYPEENPEIITSISLAVVFFNALSGSFAYARLNRIDYRSGIIFSIGTIPGAILGAVTTAYLSRWLFNKVFGLLMMAAAAALLFQPDRQKDGDMKGSRFLRRIVESDGTVHRFSYNLPLGVAISLCVGYVSSLLGVGGGFIHVPALVHFLNFPVHVATATSQFILAVMALTGTLVHIVEGSFYRGVRRTIALSIGVLIGAQFGARLSHRVRGDWIIRSLALALALAGIRLLTS